MDNSVNNIEVSGIVVKNVEVPKNVMNNVEISAKTMNNTKVSGGIKNNARVGIYDKNLHVTDGACRTNTSLGCNSRQLKFMIWNIHGLANKLDSREFVEYVSKYDVVVFLETMKLDTFKPIISNFEFLHFQRKYQHPRARRPAGGVGVMIRTDLADSKTVTVEKKSDFSVWLKIKQSGDLNLYLAAVYIPPLDSTSTISSFQNNNAYHLLQEDIAHFSQKGYVSLCGDFNARTGTLTDFVTTCGSDEHGVFVPHSNKVEYTFSVGSRHSDDKKSNQYGKELIELCKSSDMRIMNGYFNNDHSTGSFTCYTANGKSLIDYLICDAYSFTKLETFVIDPLVSESDHRPLTFSFAIPTRHSTKRHQIDKIHKNDTKFYKYVFNPDKAIGIIITTESRLFCFFFCLDATKSAYMTSC